ncbi:MAG TPA: PhoD-like phosphatase N-terminal domain-containing protein, partial [Rhodospirillales bacterium]|nr:PhoD-like phosphatase N-terminal domain-containing protein [Rhodospirillales bacterium]
MPRLSRAGNVRPLRCPARALVGGNGENEKVRRLHIDRRGFLARTAAFAAFVAAPTLAARPVLAQPRFLNDPFALGVASGEPLSDGFVIWTRLAPDPFDAEALPPQPIEVEWVVASEPGFRRVAQQGKTLAHPGRAHAVHVELRGLEAGRPYWYRFRAGGAESPVGQARTLPVAGRPLDRLRFAFTSCQHYEHGYFAAYRAMIADDPDLVIHLGDYIYETASLDPVRRHDGPEPM